MNEGQIPASAVARSRQQSRGSGRRQQLGTHDELMSLAGRYRTMFDLQAQCFIVPDEELGTTYDVLT